MNDIATHFGEAYFQANISFGLTVNKSFEIGDKPSEMHQDYYNNCAPAACQSSAPDSFRR